LGAESRSAERTTEKFVPGNTSTQSPMKKKLKEKPHSKRSRGGERRKASQGISKHPEATEWNTDASKEEVHKGTGKKKGPEGESRKGFSLSEHEAGGAHAQGDRFSSSKSEDASGLQKENTKQIHWTGKGGMQD